MGAALGLSLGELMGSRRAPIVALGMGERMDANDCSSKMPRPLRSGSAASGGPLMLGVRARGGERGAQFVGRYLADVSAIFW